MKKTLLRGSFLYVNPNWKATHGKVFEVVTTFPNKNFLDFPAGNYSLIIVMQENSRQPIYVVSNNEKISPEKLKEIVLVGKDVIIEDGNLII